MEIFTGKTALITLVTAISCLSQASASPDAGQRASKPQPPSIVSQVSSGPDAGQRASKPQPPSISVKFPYESKYVAVLGSQMHYVERGESDPILFLHGIPTSSYLWRNVMPFVADKGRVIAVDNIGFGKSDKPDIGYGFYDQARYLEAFIEALDLKNVTLVMHDWGAAFGLHYAWRHKDNVKGIVFMEGVMPPTYPRESYASFGNSAEIFRNFRDPVRGPELLIEQNYFIERILPISVMRGLTPAELARYRSPFAEPQSRRAILNLIQDNPIEGKPANVVRTFEEMSVWWSETDIPKLMLYASPGRIMPPKTAEWAAENLKNTETLFVGYGIHFIQEDNPEAVGRGIADWYRRSFQDKKAGVWQKLKSLVSRTEG